MTQGRTTRRRLLVAAPPLEDPNFDRTVVFVLEHDDTGAVGVVLNRPTTIDDVDAIDGWLARCSAPRVLFRGGPVEPAALIALAAGHDSAAEEIATIDLIDDAEAVADLDHLRIFSGYAGWGAGQLDDELRAGVWLVVDADVGDVFSADPGALWRRVLRRQPGRVALLADAPDDLSMN